MTKQLLLKQTPQPLTTRLLLPRRPLTKHPPKAKRRPKTLLHPKAVGSPRSCYAAIEQPRVDERGVWFI